MNNVFVREGKELSLEELTDFVKQLIEKNVIYSLDKPEIINLFNRIFDRSYEVIKDKVESRNYKIINQRQGLMLAYQIHIVEEIDLWCEALELRDHLQEEQEIECSIASFIATKFYPMMKRQFL